MDLKVPFGCKFVFGHKKETKKRKHGESGVGTS